MHTVVKVSDIRTASRLAIHLVSLITASVPGSPETRKTNTVIPAATVIVFRRGPGPEPELLMLQRADEMRFAGGAAVFPGGRVDPADHTLAAGLAPTDDSDDLAGRIAAIRETLEETGLVIGLSHPVSTEEAAEARTVLAGEGALEPVLARFGWSLAPEQLVPFARWLPPSERAFDTRFYLADLGTGAVELTADLTESSRLFWTSARAALDLAAEGELKVIFPTLRNLERLATFGSFAEARDHALVTPVRTITPRRITIDGEEWVTIPEDQGYPVTQERAATALRG